MALLAIAVGAAVAISLGGGAPPGVDITSPAAQALLTALREAHITYTRPDQVILAAQAVCKLVGDGQSDPDIVANIENSNGSLNEEDATKFLTLAKQLYCPQ